MFTGIIEDVGRVRDIDTHDGWARLWIDASTVIEDAAVGDSIAVNGCCLSVTDLHDDCWAADLMAETMHATALGRLMAGAPVNLERAMSAASRFGGHLVQGHVDAVGGIVHLDEQPGTVFLTITAPVAVARYLVPKGSITVDGTSLTVVDVVPDEDGSARFRVGLIPHTLQSTVFGSRSEGDEVNLEADVIAKYVERMLAAGAPSPYRPQE
jgi:riboflavin synthase